MTLKRYLQPRVLPQFYDSEYWRSRATNTGLIVFLPLAQVLLCSFSPMSSLSDWYPPLHSHPNRSLSSSFLPSRASTHHQILLIVFPTCLDAVLSSIALRPWLNSPFLQLGVFQQPPNLGFCFCRVSLILGFLGSSHYQQPEKSIKNINLLTFLLHLKPFRSPLYLPFIGAWHLAVFHDLANNSLSTFVFSYSCFGMEAAVMPAYLQNPACTMLFQVFLSLFMLCFLPEWNTYFTCLLSTNFHASLIVQLRYHLQQILPKQHKRLVMPPLCSHSTLGLCL